MNNGERDIKRRGSDTEPNTWTQWIPSFLKNWYGPNKCYTVKPDGPPNKMRILDLQENDMGSVSAMRLQRGNQEMAPYHVPPPVFPGFLKLTPRLPKEHTNHSESFTDMHRRCSSGSIGTSFYSQLVNKRVNELWTQGTKKTRHKSIMKQSQDKRRLSRSFLDRSSTDRSMLVGLRSMATSQHSSRKFNEVRESFSTNIKDMVNKITSMTHQAAASTHQVADSGLQAAGSTLPEDLLHTTKSNYQISNTINQSQKLWSCGRCWAENDEILSNCMCCGSPKPDQTVKQTSPILQKTYWSCVECWVGNDGNRNNCIRCGAPYSNDDFINYYIDLKATSELDKQPELISNFNQTNITTETGQLNKCDEPQDPTIIQQDMWSCVECFMQNNWELNSCIRCGKPNTNQYCKPTHAIQDCMEPEKSIKEIKSIKSQTKRIKSPKPGKSAQSTTQFSTAMTLHQNLISSNFVLPTNMQKGSWSCGECCVPNGSECSSCIYCEAAKPNNSTQLTTKSGSMSEPCIPTKLTSQLAQNFTSNLSSPTNLQQDFWVCGGCWVLNKLESLFCVCCRTANPNNTAQQTTKAESMSEPGIPKNTSQLAQNFTSNLSSPTNLELDFWVCGGCWEPNELESLFCVYCRTANPNNTAQQTTKAESMSEPGIPKNTSQLAQNFTSNLSSPTNWQQDFWVCGGCWVLNKLESLFCVCGRTANPNNTAQQTTKAESMSEPGIPKNTSQLAQNFTSNLSSPTNLELDFWVCGGCWEPNELESLFCVYCRTANPNNTAQQTTKAESMSEPGIPKNTSQLAQNFTSNLSSPTNWQQDFWVCGGCWVLNKLESLFCVCGRTANPNNTAQQTTKAESMSEPGIPKNTSQLAQNFTSNLSSPTNLELDFWVCGGCWEPNELESLFCVYCRTANPNNTAQQTTKAESMSEPGIPKNTSQLAQNFTSNLSSPTNWQQDFWVCGGCWVQNKLESLFCVCGRTANPNNTAQQTTKAESMSEPGIPKNTSQLAQNFTSNLSSPTNWQQDFWVCGGCWVLNKLESLFCVCGRTANPNNTAQQTTKAESMSEPGIPKNTSQLAQNFTSNLSSPTNLELDFWVCGGCWEPNELESLFCVYCRTANPNNTAQQTTKAESMSEPGIPKNTSQLAQNFTSNLSSPTNWQQDFWVCGGCWVQNKLESLFCVCGRTANPNNTAQQTTKAESMSEPGIPKNTSQLAQNFTSNLSSPTNWQQDFWVCGGCWVLNKLESLFCVCGRTANPNNTAQQTTKAESMSEPGIPKNTSQLAQNFTSNLSSPTNLELDFWVCGGCWEPNELESLFCVYCRTANPNNTAQQTTKAESMSEPGIPKNTSQLAQNFTSNLSSPTNWQQDFWVCGGCWVQNKLESLFCVCGRTANPNNTAQQTTKAESMSEPGIPKNTSQLAQNFTSNLSSPTNLQQDFWVCGGCWVLNELESLFCVCCRTANPNNTAQQTTKAESMSEPGIPKNTSQLAQNFTSNLSSPTNLELDFWVCGGCWVLNELESLFCVCCRTANPNNTAQQTTKAESMSEPGIPKNTSQLAQIFTSNLSSPTNWQLDFWVCGGCWEPNELESLFCVCGRTANPNNTAQQTTKAESMSEPGIPKNTSQLAQNFTSNLSSPTNLELDFWVCGGCWVLNELESLFCVCCRTANPNNTAQQTTKAESMSEPGIPKNTSQLAQNFTSNLSLPTNWQLDFWVCGGCWEPNELESLFCVCGRTANPNNTAQQTTKAESMSEPGIPKNTSQLAQNFTSNLSSPTNLELDFWVCGGCWVPNESKRSCCICCSVPKPNNSAQQTTKSEITPEPGIPMKLTSQLDMTSNFVLPTNVQQASWSCGECWVPNGSESSSCIYCDAEKPNNSAQHNTKSSDFIPESGIPMKHTSQLSNLLLPTNLQHASWSCGECWVPNSSERSKCIRCGASNPNNYAHQSTKSETMSEPGIPMKLTSQLAQDLTSFDIACPQNLHQVSWMCVKCFKQNVWNLSVCTCCNTLKADESTQPNLEYKNRNKSTKGFQFENSSKQQTQTTAMTSQQDIFSSNLILPTTHRTDQYTSIPDKSTKSDKTSHTVELGNSVKPGYSSKPVKSAKTIKSNLPVKTNPKFAQDLIKFMVLPGILNQLSWSCDECWVRNELIYKYCICCRAPKPDQSNNQTSQISLLEYRTALLAQNIPLETDKSTQPTSLEHRLSEPKNIESVESTTKNILSTNLVLNKTRRSETGKSAKPGISKRTLKSTKTGKAAKLRKTIKPGKSMKPEKAKVANNLICSGVLQKDTWPCDGCLIRNEQNISICICCESPKPNAFINPTSLLPQLEQQSPVLGAPPFWWCLECFKKNDEHLSKCIMCCTPKPDNYTKPIPNLNKSPKPQTSAIAATNQDSVSFNDLSPDLDFGLQPLFYSPSVNMRQDTNESSQGNHLSWWCIQCFKINIDDLGKCITCGSLKPDNSTVLSHHVNQSSPSTEPNKLSSQDSISL